MVKPIALSLLLATSAVAAPSAAASSWKGWNKIKHTFTFGDSYSQTGFDPTGTQPSPSNPLGNPSYPGWTSSNGPNWIGFLATTYNASRIQAYNFAYGGATVDSNLVAPWQPSVLSVKHQVKEQFVPIYGSHPSSAPWTSEDSLFGFFIGINDVLGSWWLNNATLYDEIFSVYSGLLDDIYKTGGRNFLFLSVPPVNLSPLSVGQDVGGNIVKPQGVAIQNWNAKLTQMAQKFKASHAGSKIFLHDTWGLYNTVFEKPTSYPQTSGLKNVTGYCEAYSNGTPDWYTKYPSCAYAVNEYLWLNNLHPTFPINNATAASIAQLLKSG